MTPTIRSAAVDDIPTLLRFVRELAEYEQAASSVVTTPEMLRIALFENGSTAKALIAEAAGQPVGFAIYFQSFSTWTGRPGLYLEDLYVEPSARRLGIGAKILQHLAELALASGCARLEWAVLDWNQSAIDFYLSKGAEQMSEWRTYRVSGQALADLAGS